MMRRCALAAALLAASCGPASQTAAVTVCRGQVVRAYPHDSNAFTEGVFYLNGFLYEGTGGDRVTGEVVQRHVIPPEYFGEGIVAWKDKLLDLTWKGEKGWIYDLATFTPNGEFDYPGEGWALTTDGACIIMDDGTPELRFWNPGTLPAGPCPT